MPDKSINISELYASMQALMIKKLEIDTVAFTHPGTMGDNTESNWIEYFKEFLPARYSVDKATIIDSTGKCSDQIDVVIYDAQYSYLVFPRPEGKLIPAESVYAVFEVKQNLSKEHMEYAQDKAASVRCLSRTSTRIPHAGGYYTPKPLHQILAGVLTTRSDWASPIASKVVQYMNAADRDKHLDFVCAIGNNTFVADHCTNIDDDDPTQVPVVRYCSAEDSLVFLLLNLLKRLQDIGTVPAIDYMQYANVIGCEEYKPD